MPSENPSQPTPDICLRGVHKHFGSLHVLNDVSFDVARGETVVVMGASGCGKSTLLRCINGLEPVDAGIVAVEGEDIANPNVNLTHLRAKVGMVFQQFNLFPHLTVLENITLAPRKVKGTSEEESRQTAMALLERIGIPDKAHTWPDRLSGGQQQRVAIARCLAMQPNILLLDEPTSALDPVMANEVMSLVQELSGEGLTIVLVSHNVRFAEQTAHKILFMEAGRVVEMGTPREILRAPQQPQTQNYLAALT